MKRKVKKRDAVLVRGEANGVIAEMRALSRETGVPASTLWLRAVQLYLLRMGVTPCATSRMKAESKP